MIDKTQAQQKGLNIIDSTKENNPLKSMLEQNFPETLSEGQVNLKALAMLLGLNPDSNAQGYELTFTGKGLANTLYTTPVEYELSEEIKQSKNRESTDNSIIIGDNLDVLKILKSAYYEKIKMIYIDPPYNTKSENFIYPDDFRKDYKKILQEVGLLTLDDEGKEVESKTLQTFRNITGSRSHSGWLSFMLPRLKLARDLLREDGAIFISIDDNEQANLKILCDEIFGEENFVLNFSRLTSSQRPSQEKYASITHDFLLCYAKNKEYSCFERVIKRDLKNVKMDKIGRFIIGDTSPILASATQGYSQGGDYDFEYNGKIYPPIDRNGKRRRWLWNKERMEEAKRLDILVETKNGLRVKNYIDMEFEVGTNKMIPKSPNLILTSLDLYNTEFTNNHGTSNLSDLGMVNCFSFPKPTSLINLLIKLLDLEGDIILDFFAGSGTTAQAVMEVNAEDEGNRKFILVQLPEEIKEDKNETAYDFVKNKLGKNEPKISDITIERVNRAGEKLKEEGKNIDIGYRVYSLEQKARLSEEGSIIPHSATTSPQDIARNLALFAGKLLHTPLEEIIKDKLFSCEDILCVVGIDKEVEEKILEEKNKAIFIDGYGNYTLESFLNLNIPNDERVNIIY